MNARETLPVLVLVDGGELSEELADAVQAAGASLEPLLELMPALHARLLLMVRAGDAMLGRALAPPYQGLIQSGRGAATPFLEPCVRVVARGGLCLSVDTATACAGDLSGLVAQAATRRFGLDAEAAGSLELALGEAVGNALLHGNLGMASGLRRDYDGFAQFRKVYGERLMDPALAGRRILVTVEACSNGIEVRVADQGEGFDLDAELARPVDPDAKSGRGLALIRCLAAQVRGEDGGRCLVMVFPGGAHA